MADRLARFAAAIFHSQDDENVAMVGFADDRLNAKNFIILQRTLCPSEQDVALGHDAVHVTVCGQERSGYGGLTSVSVASNYVTFTFDQHTADMLRVGSELVVDASATTIDRAVLVSNLRQVCDDRVPVVVAD